MKIYSEEIHRARASRLQERLYDMGRNSILRHDDTTAYCAFFWELRDQNEDLVETLQIDVLSSMAVEATEKAE